MNRFKLCFVAVLMAVSSAATAAVSPIAALGPGNVGITAFSAAFSGNTITLNETWGATGPGSILLSGFILSTPRTVIRNITNNTGSAWTSFANELLPPGNAVPGQPGFIPVGFRPSPNNDSLSFDQNGSIPRSSSFFTTTFADELGGRDYLDFSNGVWANNATGTMSFGLRPLDTIVGFLLFQRPNERTSVVPVPAALPLLLSGLGILGFLSRRRNKA